MTCNANRAEQDTWELRPDEVSVGWDRKGRKLQNQSPIPYLIISSSHTAHPQPPCVQQEMECEAFALVNTFHKHNNQSIIID